MNIGTRKLIWSVPLVAVLAVVGALAIFAAQAPAPASAHGVPGVVGNLTGEAEGTTQIDLRWDAPTEGGTPTGYRIDRSTDGDTWMSLATDHTSLTYSDMGLEPNMPYYYRVFAVNSAGIGPVSQDYRVQTDAVTAPRAVIGLTATAMGQNQVNLSWSAPSNTGGASITKYSIHWASGTTDIPVQTVTAGTDTEVGGVTVGSVIDVDVADGTTYSHKKLTGNTRYKYIVYAWNMAGGKATVESDIAAATTESLDRPGAPTGVTAVQTGAVTFNLYWFAPSDNGGTAPIDYQIWARYDGAGNYTNVSAAADWRDALGASADASHEVPAGTDSVQYRVYTITRNDDASTLLVDEQLISAGYGQSLRMEVLSDEDLAKNVPAAPGFAEGDQAKRDGKGNVDLKWTAPPVDSDDVPGTSDCDAEDRTGCNDDNAIESIGGYRIDVSDDGLQWRPLINHSRKTATEYQYVDDEKKNREYRIFAWHAQFLGSAQTDAVGSALTEDALSNPGHVMSFTATAVSPSQIDLSWSAPTNDGNADVVLYRIDAVRDGTGTDGTGFIAFPEVETAAADDLPEAASGEGTRTATSKTTGYMHKNLNAGETWKYRVLAITDSEATTGNIRTSPAATAETRLATTPQASLPEAPEGLTAEDAKDSSRTGASDRGVLLLWNAPNPPDGAMIDGYRIQRKKGDAAWEPLVADTGDNDTDYTDTSEPAAGEMRQYQVAALNGTKLGAYSDPVYYPAMMHVPGKPTLSAMKVEAMPGSQIKLTWTAPAMNADSVDGYIIERRYGDMMMDITGYSGTDGANRNHAFMDYKEWWETLDCNGMLQAANIAPASATDEQKGMYCKHFLDTAPSMVADTDANADKKISDATAMKVKDLFMKRYVTDDMGKTKTMFTGMMYTDMDLMENTEYTYRVRAIHGMQAGPWSDKAMETTGVETPLQAPTLKATSGTGSVTLSWDEQAAAVEYTVWGVRPDGSAVRAGSTDALIRVNDVTTTTYTVTRLMSEEEYWFAVTACEMADCDDAGNYLHSNVAIATPD